MQKTCKLCAHALPIGRFHKNRSAKDGHDNRCKDCTKKRYQENREQIIARACARQERDAEGKSAYDKARRLALGDAYRQRVREYYTSNADKVKAYQRGYKQKNRDKTREWNRESAARNPDAQREKRARRRLRELSASPSWSNKGAVLSIYQLAKEIESLTGVKMHVDHIVPLVSPMVCGLHCEANLQVIIASENLTKGNRYWPDMP